MIDHREHSLLDLPIKRMSIEEAEELGIYHVCDTLEDLQKVFLSIQLGNRPKYASIPSEAWREIFNLRGYGGQGWQGRSGNWRFAEVLPNAYVEFYLKDYNLTEIRFCYDDDMMNI